MSSVYTRYFQKSKIFLYPLLGLKRGLEYIPKETYIRWKGVYNESDLKFLCLYNTKFDSKFALFQQKYLKENTLFERYIELDSDNHLYIFNYDVYRTDYKRFIFGKYSKFSENSKIIINDFFNGKGLIDDYVASFLYPDIYHVEYAEELGININIIKEVYEICSIPDMTKETLDKEIPGKIVILNDNSISLEKF